MLLVKHGTRVAVGFVEHHAGEFCRYITEHI